MRNHPSSVLSLLVSAGLLTACNPTYNWRDHTSSAGRFQVQFPAKPATYTRNIDLGGLRVDMSMTAAEVEGTTFAIGTAVLPDATMAQAILPSMRAALVRNIGATASLPADQPGSAVLELDATGKGSTGPMRITGRFMAKGNRVYQVIVVGAPTSMRPEQAEQFLTSFAPQ